MILILALNASDGVELTEGLNEPFRIVFTKDGMERFVRASTKMKKDTPIAIKETKNYRFNKDRIKIHDILCDSVFEFRQHSIKLYLYDIFEETQIDVLCSKLNMSYVDDDLIVVFSIGTEEETIVVKESEVTAHDFTESGFKIHSVSIKGIFYTMDKPE